MVRVAVVQFDPVLGDTDKNLSAIEEHMSAAAESGAELAVFPECAVTGYLYLSLTEAMETADTIPGANSDRLIAAARRQNLHIVVGMLEWEDARCYNTAIVAGPEGLIAVYRKTHLLCLGVDRYTSPGNIPFRVLDLPFGRLGVLICYDLRFPECARILALAGAQIIALPTNWPASSAIQADVLTQARAAENRVFVLAADRVGVERDSRFLGRSQIVAPDGTVLREASRERTEMLVMDIDVTQSDVKRVVIREGEHEMDVVADRRPELYGELIRESVPAHSR